MEREKRVWMDVDAVVAVVTEGPTAMHPVETRVAHARLLAAVLLLRRFVQQRVVATTAVSQGPTQNHQLQNTTKSEALCT
jgi:hypothetical protein